ncbi:MAG: hypothetical protein ABIR96_10315, partial [Bdellovibrionota bacterium]
MALVLDMSARTILSRAETYADFVALYFENSGESYAAFARRAGFDSRSFPRDVATRKRRISPKSLAKFSRAMKLGASGEKLFEILVAESEEDVRTTLRLKSEAIPELLARARLRFRQDSAKPRESKISEKLSDLDEIFSVPWVAPLMAAMGDTDEGASLSDIARRLPNVLETTLVTSLARLERIGFCRFESGNYVPQNLHEKIKGAGKSAFFRKLYEEASLRSMRRAAVAIDSDEEFFFLSSFLVSESRMPELKLKLRALMMDFVDENIDSKGQVAEISCSLHKLAN